MSPPKPASKRKCPGPDDMPDLPTTHPDVDLDPQFRSYLDSVIEHKIADAIKPHLELIDQLQKTIEDKNRRIKELETQVAQLSGSSKLPPNPSSGLAEGDTLRRFDELEQRGRLWSVRISGVAEKDVITTDQLVMDIGKSIGAEIQPSEIDWSHFNSKPDPVKGRQVIVRFCSRNVRARFLRAKKRLREKDNPFSKLYVNEDLTRPRYQLLSCLLQKRREKVISAAWSFQGNIFFKKRDEDKPVKITNVLGFDLDSV